MLTVWVVSWLVRSNAAKKWVLSLMMGPPRLAPNWCRRYSPLGWLVVLLRRGLRVQALVAEQLEGGAVELVRAALGDDLEGAAVRAAGVGAEALRLEVELADRVEREQLHQAADRVVVVVPAVDQVVDVAAAAAGDLRRELRRLGGVGVEAEAHAGNERGEVAELAPVERQVLDLLLVMISPTPVAVESMSGASATTVSSSVWPATPSRTSGRGGGADVDDHAPRVDPRSRSASILTSYVPTGRPGTRKIPFASVTAERLKPVELFWAVTFAPGRARPCSSATLPSIAPVVPCANAVRRQERQHRQRPETAHVLHVGFLPRVQ